MDKKLGRGLASLIGEESEIKRAKIIHPSQNMQNERIIELEISKLHAGKFQPRNNFLQEELEELSDSIKEHGVVSPIIVRKSQENFEIIAGERRFRAAKMAGLSKIPAIVRDIEDKKALEISIIENIQRQDLTTVEEAKALQNLIDYFNYSHEQVAQTLGKSRSHVTNMLRILKLPQEVLDLLDKKTISFGHARAMINSSDDPIKLSEILITNDLSVRELENLIKKRNKEKNIKPIDSFEFEKRYKNFMTKNNYKEPEIIEIERKLTSILNSDVEINYDKSKGGQIILKFSNLNQLDSIIRKINQIQKIQLQTTQV